MDSAKRRLDFQKSIILIVITSLAASATALIVAMVVVIVGFLFGVISTNG